MAKVVDLKIHTLPYDMLEQICTHLNDAEISKIMLTNKNIAKACKEILEKFSI